MSSKRAFKRVLTKISERGKIVPERFSTLSEEEKEFLTAAFLKKKLPVIKELVNQRQMPIVYAHGYFLESEVDGYTIMYSAEIKSIYHLK